MEPFGMIASAGADLGLGLITRRINEKLDLEQQARLNEQQFAIDGRALARQKAAELQQFEDTGYGAQLRQMKESNLSPGMMYGGSGGGAGQLGGSTGSVNAPKASNPANLEALGMTVAQRKLIEAQTENVKADTIKKSGVDTDLTREQGRMAKIMANVAAQTEQEVTEQAQARSIILWQEAKLAKGTVNIEFQRKQAELLGVQLANEARKADTRMTEAEIIALGEEVAQKWKALEIQQGHLDIQKFVQDVSNSTKLTVETITKAVQMVGGGMIQKGLKEMPNKSEHTKKIEW